MLLRMRRTKKEEETEEEEEEARRRRLKEEQARISSTADTMTPSEESCEDIIAHFQHILG